MNYSNISLFICFFICLVIVFFYAKSNQKSPLIPREILFGNPVKSSPKISPDGTKIAYLAPWNNVLNVWIKSIGKNDDQVITQDQDRGIRQYFWSFDNKHIFYVQDKNGNENWILYDINIETKKTRILTPFENITVKLLKYSKYFPDKMLIQMNSRDPKIHDVYELDIASGNLKLIAENKGNISFWEADNNLNIKLAVESLSNGGCNLLLKNDDSNSWEIIRTYSLEDVGGLDIIGFSKDNNYIYLTDPCDSNTSRLIKFNISNKTIKVIYQDDEYDLNDTVLMDPDTYEIKGISINKAKKEWVLFDKNIEDDFEIIKNLDYGQFHVISCDVKQRKLIICFEKDNGPLAYWYFDRDTKKGEFLFNNNSELKKYKLSLTEPIKYTSKDGLTIHGYMTYPIDIERKNLPLVLHVHGGPWLRDSWGYNPTNQYFANRGYAVLQVNFRGSTGYGKKFLNAGNKEWSKKMHQDLIDAVQWAINQGTIDSKKVAIFGGSYGGYAALVGATFTPDLFCCAIDIVGPSNLLTLIKTIPPYWSTELDNMYKRIGNPETEEEFLKECSPLFKVDAIKIPILIAQGANDPRVKQSESEQIIEAMKSKNIPYEYLLFPDEGHGFAKPQNRMKFFIAAEKFLAKHLGGRFEPEN